MPIDDMHDGLPPLLNLDTLAKGAVYEMVGDAFKALAANISDPNTSEKQKRSVTIKIECDPYPDRSGFTYAAKVETKLAGMTPAEGTAYIARKGGEYLAVGKNQNQLEIELRAAEGDGTPMHSRPQ